MYVLRFIGNSSIIFLLYDIYFGSNDDEWYRLVSGIRSIMLKTSSVRKYAHAVEEVTDDLVEEISRTRAKNGQIPNMQNLLARWSQESNYHSFHLRIN